MYIDDKNQIKDDSIYILSPNINKIINQKYILVGI